MVKSQRPLQVVVRLLEKEKEEREVDQNFKRQEDEIFEKAQQIEDDKKAFEKNQTKQIRLVKSKMQEIIDNANKRKLEEEKKRAEEKEIAAKEAKIKELKAELEKSGRVLEEKRRKEEQYREFLEEVIGDDDEKDIEELKSRFQNLKQENMKLKKRKEQIDVLVEETREAEKKEVTRL